MRQNEMLTLQQIHYLVCFLQFLVCTPFSNKKILYRCTYYGSIVFPRNKSEGSDVHAERLFPVTLEPLVTTEHQYSLRII